MLNRLSIWNVSTRSIKCVLATLLFYDHIIHVHFHIPPELVLEEFVDHPLVSCPRVFQANGHHLVTIRLTVGDQGSVLLIMSCHPDLVIARECIHECEEFMACSGVD